MENIRARLTLPESTGFDIILHKVIHRFWGKVMSYLYTGSTQDIHALDTYLESVMDWIDELKERYGIDSKELLRDNKPNNYTELDK